MKKIIRFLMSFSFLIISILLLSSCKKYKIDFNLYHLSNKTINGIKFVEENTSKKYSDNTLELDFDLSLTNTKNKKLKLEINNPIAYANDAILPEKIYKNYNNDSHDNELFNKEEYELNKKENIDIRFILVIENGNVDAKYNLSFDFNNIKLNINYHEEGYETDKFIYAHNPSSNPKVLADAEVNEDAVYGFMPNATGSLASYRDYNWSNKGFVENAKKIRIEYIETNDKMIKELENELRNQNKNIEEIARACSNLRNQLRLDAYKDDPEGLAALKQRNLEKYGHEEGPLPEESYEKYGSWERVLEKCYNPNPAMDACCGVYDMYYYLYS